MSTGQAIVRLLHLDLGTKPSDTTEDHCWFICFRRFLTAINGVYILIKGHDRRTNSWTSVEERSREVHTCRKETTGDILIG